MDNLLSSRVDHVLRPMHFDFYFGMSSDDLTFDYGAAYPCRDWQDVILQRVIRHLDSLETAGAKSNPDHRRIFSPNRPRSSAAATCAHPCRYRRLIVS